MAGGTDQHPVATHPQQLLADPLLFSPLMSTLAWLGLAGPNAGLLNVFLEGIFQTPNPPIKVNIYSFWGMILILFINYTPLCT